MSQPKKPPIKFRRGVIGVIARQDKFLVIQRAPGIARGGCWCFPGGHLEPGENSRRAIIREIYEELGIAVEPIRRLGSVRVMESRYILAVWLVRVEPGARIRPAESEIADVRWLTLPEIRSMQPGLPSNETVVEMLSRLNRNRGGEESIPW